MTLPWEGRDLQPQPGQTTADAVRQALSGGNVRAASMTAGYAMLDDGNRVLFEAARELSDKRNSNGRCIKHVVQFKDGSKLQFTWSENRGPKYSIPK